MIGQFHTAVAVTVALAMTLPSLAQAQQAHLALSFDVTEPTQASPELHFPRPAHYAVSPLKNMVLPEVMPQLAPAGSLPLWSGSQTVAGVKYTYRMVGNDPNVAQAQQSTAVPGYLIPIAVQFTKYGVTLDPTQPDPLCSPAGDAFTLVQQSPIFQPVTLSSGATPLGTGQYTDLFQRANFWSTTQPGGLNPDYHVTVTPNVLPGVKVTLKVAGGPAPSTGGSICGKLGRINLNTFDKFIQNTVIPALPAAVTAATLPVFVLYNTVLYQGLPALCCVLGYHGAYNRSGAMQTYSVAGYDSTNAFTGVKDVASLSHEVAEWLDDPSGTNATPKWGHIGQVSGCQSNLEVGDPLSGVVAPVTMPNGVTYHVQDEAFLSWFYRMTPSIGVNGSYSMFGTFVTPAAPCP